MIDNAPNALIAPEGYMWVCQACGKKAKHQYGNHVEGYKTSFGYDESCVMNCKLEKIDDPS